ncbi:MAG: NAD(P)/FAD-dependent oxidoreductase [Georgenia sp.]
MPDPTGNRDLTGAAARPPRSVCVVGAGLAGLRTVAELRARGFTGTVTVVGAEGLAPYDRPPLSKELFTRPSPVWLADEGYGDLDTLADRVLLARTAVELRADDDGATLTPADGEEIRADVVVLAVGAHAIVPSGWTGALVLHEAPDAAALRAALRPGARLVVVGAGWIGAEIAGVAASRGVDVTVLEAAPTPLHRQIGGELGARTVPWYAAAGIDLRCGVEVRGVAGGAVTLSGGERLDADAVLVAVGARPATGWLAGAVPLTGRGAVPVDPGGRVVGGPASVRAVGDCADMTVPGLGLVPGGHWDGALTHPAALVTDLLGGRAAPPAAAYVFSTQLGHDLTFVGVPTAQAELVLREDGAGWTALFVELSDQDAGGPDATGRPVAGQPATGRPATGGPVTGRLTAGFTVDRPRDVGPLRKLLAGGARPVLDLDRAADPGVPLRKAVR